MDSWKLIQKLREANKRLSFRSVVGSSPLWASLLYLSLPVLLLLAVAIALILGMVLQWEPIYSLVGFTIIPILGIGGWLYGKLFKVRYGISQDTKLGAEYVSHKAFQQEIAPLSLSREHLDVARRALEQELETTEPTPSPIVKLLNTTALLFSGVVVAAFFVIYQDELRGRSDVFLWILSAVSSVILARFTFAFIGFLPVSKTRHLLHRVRRELIEVDIRNATSGSDHLL